MLILICGITCTISISPYRTHDLYYAGDDMIHLAKYCPTILTELNLMRIDFVNLITEFYFFLIFHSHQTIAIDVSI